MAGAVAGLQAAVGHAGAVHSAQFATDEGDPVNSFTMQVAGKTICGSFWKTTFKDGDLVQVIGQELNGVFEAVAVTKPDERMIWMRPHSERGTNSKKQHLLKVSGLFVLLGLSVEFILTFFTSPPVWPMLLGFSLCIVVVLFVTVGMSWRDFMNFASEMNAVGAALHLPEPEKMDLFKLTKQARQNGKMDLPMGVYYYQLIKSRLLLS